MSGRKPKLANIHYYLRDLRLVHAGYFLNVGVVTLFRR